MTQIIANRLATLGDAFNDVNGCNHEWNKQMEVMGNLMSPYAVHWEGIKRAREKECPIYGVGSISPVPDSSHPFYGMYRFKTGFGGRIIHRNGSWDYPFNMKGYEKFRNMELLSRFMPAASCS